MVGLLGACGGGANSATEVPRLKAETLRVSGSTTVNPVAADAAEVLRKQGLTVTVDTQGGSAGGIAQLGEGQIEVAMSSKEVADEDRQAHPTVDFVSTRIGADAVGIVIRKEVYDGGVKSLSKGQLKDVFEGKVTNWSELGGPDLPVFVYDKEPGRGTREVLDKYLYGKDVKAPPPPRSDNYAIVGGNEETRAKLLSTPGSVGPLSSAFVADRPELVAVAVDGVFPTSEHIKDRTYPMARPLFLVTDGKPTGPAKSFVDFVVSPAGQRIVTSHGYLTLAELHGG
ncbi:MAG TPA: phosphate ABC transporter substrate-binding protein [Acidimicrobiales bacterium]|nr:phosphate ABC transporter substrate-binding protein [Acidimicrobiales bacterium]